MFESEILSLLKMVYKFLKFILIILKIVKMLNLNLGMFCSVLKIYNLN